MLLYPRPWQQYGSFLKTLPSQTKPGLPASDGTSSFVLSASHSPMCIGLPAAAYRFQGYTWETSFKFLHM